MDFGIFKSTSLTTVFQNAAKAIHTGTDWNADFEKALAIKLLNKGLKKTEIAYQMANAIDEDLSNPVKNIQIAADEEADTINYLVKAIKYATGN